MNTLKKKLKGRKNYTGTDLNMGRFFYILKYLKKFNFYRSVCMFLIVFNHITALLKKKKHVNMKNM